MHRLWPAVFVLIALSLSCGGGSSTGSGSGGNNNPPPGPQLTVTLTSPLPNGTQNLAYALRLTAANGTQCSGANPYTWTVNSGSLPAGLSISGQSISGTATSTGASTFVLKASDCGNKTALSGTLSITVDPTPTPVQGLAATVDFGNVHQTIRGFGGSDAWMPVMPAAEVSALFGTGPGQIGLSILRARIDPSSTTGGPNWDTEVTNAKNALTTGSNVIVFATPWTPPAIWKDNNSLINGGSLTPSNYSAYANYLESFVTYMANHGVNLYAISMQNEPDWTPSYESCQWTAQEMDTWVAQDAGVLTTKLIMPESLGFNQSFSDPTLQDANAVNKVAIIGGHLYGARPTFYANAVSAGKELWMTEHYLDPVGPQPAIGDALLVAKEIHDSLTVGDYNAYVWWWVANWNPGAGVTNIGLVDTNNAPTYFGWAIAQFSKFIRPGYTRVDVSSGTPNVYVSAFKGNSHYVIVAVNAGNTDVDQPFTIQNQSLTSVIPYQTTNTATVTAQTAVSVSGSQFTYTLPAQSITTFVQ